jgi:hypothetical protein
MLYVSTGMVICWPTWILLGSGILLAAAILEAQLAECVEENAGKPKPGWLPLCRSVPPPPPLPRWAATL